MWLERLVAIKKASGKTLKQISSESGVPIGTLNKLFAGQTKDPKLDTVRSVVHALGYTLDDLTADSPQITKKSPSTAEAAPGEDIQKLLKALDGFLVNMEYISADDDLTEQQEEVLIGVCRILRATFEKK